MIEGNKQRSLQPKLSQDEADTLLDDEIYLASGVSCRYHHLHVKFRANTVFISQQGNPYSSWFSQTGRDLHGCCYSIHEK